MGRTRCDEELAERLGVSADVVASVRTAEDTERKGRGLVFTAEGEARVAAELGCEIPAAKKEGGGVEPPDALDARILRTCRNPTWVMCELPGHDEPVAVRVKNNLRLHRGNRVRVMRRGDAWVAGRGRV